MTARHKNKHTHGKHAKHYIKTYWPYLPLMMFVGLGLFISFYFRPTVQPGVLSYATNITSGGLLSATNQQRVNNSESSLALNSLLTQAAQAKANDMVNRDYWSHNTPDGKQPWVFIDATGYAYKAAGENLAYGFLTSDDAVTGWMNSPAHRDNILNAGYKEVGFGIANSSNYQNTGPETIVVAMYGSPIGAIAAITPTPPPAAAPAPQPAPAPVPTPAPTPPVVPQPEPSPIATNKPAPASPDTKKEPGTASVSIAQALTGGAAPWSTFATGLILISCIAYLVIRHSLRIRRKLMQGERYILHHPLVDITILSLTALCILLKQTVGFIR